MIKKVINSILQQEGDNVMNRFEMLVDEFKTNLGRNLSQKELEWIKWVVDRENREEPL